MTGYGIELYWPGMTEAMVDDLVRRAARMVRDEPIAVRYVGCTLAPRDETCVLRVVASDEESVRRFAAKLGIERGRIAELVDVPTIDEPPHGS
jgi:hypothetical protein